MKREGLLHNFSSTKEVQSNLVLLHCSVLNDAHGDDYGGVYSSEVVAGVVIADGVGGTDKGSIASRVAVEESLKLIKSLDFMRSQDSASYIRDAFNAMLKTLPELIKKSMDSKTTTSATTLATAITDSSRLYIFNIGDSQIYFFPFVRDYSKISMPDYMKLSAGSTGTPLLLHSVSHEGLQGNTEFTQLQVPADGFALLLGTDGSNLNSRAESLHKNLDSILNQYQRSHEAGKEMMSESVQTVISDYLRKEKAKDDDGTVALMILLPIRTENYYRAYMSVARSTRQSYKFDLQGGNVAAEVRKFFQDVTVETAPEPSFEGNLEITVGGKVSEAGDMEVYRWFEITTRGNGSYTLKNLNVVFRVEQEWFRKINANPSALSVIRVNGTNERFSTKVIGQKSNHYLFSADLNKMGKYAVGIPESKMLEGKLSDKFDQIASETNILKQRLDKTSAETKSELDNRQKIFEDNLKRQRGEIGDIMARLKSDLTDVATRIEQQKKESETKTRNIEAKVVDIVSKTDKQWSELETRLRNFETKTVDIGGKIEQQRKDSENRIKSIETKFPESAAKINKLCTELETKLGNAESKLADSNAKNEQQRKDYDVRFRNVDVRMVDNENKLRFMEARTADAAAKAELQRKDLESRLKGIETRIGEVTARIDKKWNEVEYLLKSVEAGASVIGSKIDQQRKDVDNRFKNVESIVTNLGQDIESLKKEKAEPKRALEASGKNIARVGSAKTPSQQDKS